MVNVALISHSAQLHGAECSLLLLTEILSKKGIHPILMIPMFDTDELISMAQKKGYEVIYTPPNPWYIYKSPKNIYDFGCFCETVKQDIKTFIKLFKEAKTDIVIINTLTNFIPHLAAYHLNLPIITWVHGVLEPAFIPGMDPLYQSVIDRAIINLSDKVIMNSEWTRKRFENVIDRKKAITIPNWTSEPDEHVPYNATINNFICLNSFEPQKGNNTLIDAAKIIKDMRIKIQVNLYGTGIEMQNMINQINELQVNDCVLINQPTADVTKLYNDCSALIQPSFYESFGRTIIEAMAHKRPVITADTADPENIVIDGKNGFHFKAGNSNELAEKMIYIINNKNKAKRMGEKGYNIYKSHYDGRAAKKKIINLINNLYKISIKHTSLQQYSFDILNLIHKL